MESSEGHSNQEYTYLRLHHTYTILHQAVLPGFPRDLA